jgi:hypothetical protein
MRKGQIAEALQVTRRTVYNYLNDRVFSGPQSRGCPAGVSKLSPFYPQIEERLEDDFFLNADVLYHQLKGGGYQGGITITILRDYLRRRRDELCQRAILLLFLFLHFCFCPPWTAGFMPAKSIARKAWHAPFPATGAVLWILRKRMASLTVSCDVLLAKSLL